MPEKIRKFHQVNNVIQFMYDRPYHKGTKDRENEFKVRRILSWDTDSIIFYTMVDQLFTLLQASTL